MSDEYLPADDARAIAREHGGQVGFWEQGPDDDDLVAVLLRLARPEPDRYQLHVQSFDGKLLDVSIIVRHDDLHALIDNPVAPEADE
jgi:hypothetical protein